MKKTYDIVIVGGGPAGLTAGIYARRSGMSALLLEEYVCGGQTINTYEIKNYPGFDNISGEELSQKTELQAKNLGLEIEYQRALNFDLEGDIKVINTANNSYFAKTVIFCTGAGPRKLNVDGEQQFSGRGVSYCAVCDGGFFKDKTVAIVGGGNSAMEDVAYLTNIAKQTYLINRTDKYRAVPTLVKAMQNLQQQGKITVLNNTIVTEIAGEKSLKHVTIQDVQTKAKQQLKLDGLFIEIGRVPNTEMLKGIVKLDEYGYIITDQNLMTSVKGVFAAGDVRQKNLRQIITACSDGAIASTNANKYLSEREND